MAANNPLLQSKWKYLLLAVLLILLFLLSLFTLSPSMRSEFAFASQQKADEVNQPPADSNEKAKQKQEEPEQKEPNRPEHKHRAFMERSRERERMVTGQIKARRVSDPNVLNAMLAVPRHAFVRPGDLARAYADHPLPIGLGQTISQPYIVGYMTEALKLRPDFKVLEIGTGSGYQAAVCAEIAREVYTIEIIEELAKSARERLKELGYPNVFVKAADGYFGWPQKGPFDAIIVTCVAGFVPPPLVEQLKPDGIMVTPLGSPFGPQRLVLITKDQKGEVRSKSLLSVRFVPMRGAITEGQEQLKK